MVSSTKKLNNGLEIPAIGFGAWKLKEGSEAKNAVKWALEAGYRLIDTAMIYGNENSVGKAMRDSGIPREEIFVTTKLWNENQGYETTLKAIDASLERLGLDYVDLYLIHWPTASAIHSNDNHLITINKRAETWKAMEEIYKSKKAKSIGVSNYTIRHLEEMKQYANVTPVINQVEFHPFLFQEKLLTYCLENQIVLEAYSPLARGRKMDNKVVDQLAKKYNKSNAQILLRWSLEHGCIPIPKSTHQERIKENLNVFDFEMEAEDIKALDDLNENLHLAWNPEEVL